MSEIEKILLSPGRFDTGGVPEGYDALILERLIECQSKAGQLPVIFHVARDESRLVFLTEALQFFAPGLEVLEIPAWDCVPYDRVSPHGEVVAKRIDSLSRLAARFPGRGENQDSPLVVITTVSAVLQRVPPRSMMIEEVVRLRKNHPLSQEVFYGFLTRNGYQRVETVREAGEYAVRGGLVDLFPPGCEEPARLDLFGDDLEGIRVFDPVTQLTSGERQQITLKPASECTLDPTTIKRFRNGYRDLFGAGGGEDPLYEAISSGRKMAGMEHWLPLFHETLETLFDYLPGAAITLDHQCEEAMSVRHDMIRDYYEARISLAGNGGDMAISYKPLPPKALYLEAEEWRRLTSSRASCVFSPFLPTEDSPAGYDAGGRGGQDFAHVRSQPDADLFGAVKEVIENNRAEGRRVVLSATSEGSCERLATLLKDHNIGGVERVESWPQAQELPPAGVPLAVLGLEYGFSSPHILFISEQDILGDRFLRRRKKRRPAEAIIAEASALTEGDLVVHSEHGIGRFKGLETLEVESAPHDFVRLTYDGGDKLYVPVETIEVLSRYGGEDAARPDRLGGVAWQARKAKVKKRIRLIADELIRVAAQRELRDGEKLNPESGVFDEFCARFPYPETEDQLTAIEDTLDDMAGGKPMDRLICGDVGFGKTEVALRAAFVAAMNGVQVAVIVPTTLLCRQHLSLFRSRFSGLPLCIEQLSRLTPQAKTEGIRKGLSDGSIDIVIGTHTLLGKKISFHHLGLLIVDEEQHFGVAQKERLKQLRADVHILTLTATPIPRTLQLALSGVREMSLIATPPIDRLAVRTFVLPFDPVILREAILREHFRGGQTFYVCPRIRDLAGVEEKLKEMVPEVSIVSAHGRMGARELEDKITAFYDGKYEILLSTSIIESGLDIPTANTLIVHRADMFGLAQLYQIRGRIGRSKTRAYAYLTLPPGRVLAPAAQKRLEVLHNLDTLGAGFTLASHDLDIRGAGNLLGSEQSGHIREVGIELYQHMIEEAVAEARGIDSGNRGEGEAAFEDWTPQITLGSPVLIPENYVADLGLRLSLYRRIARLMDPAEIDAFAVELHDRFGPVPQEVENLFHMVAIKQYCRKAGVEKVEAGIKGAVLSFHKDTFANPSALVEFIATQAGTVKLRPDHKLVYRRDWNDPQARLKGVQYLLRRISEVAATSPRDPEEKEGPGRREAPAIEPVLTPQTEDG